MEEIMASVMIFIGVVGWICLLVSIIVYFKTKEQKILIL
ncbi:putative membrane protein [[Clostridium] sordellii ATCC 9714]|nr:putative membrane protein [[Clostridium] sordellii ATCC 9714] [Paeniclostridium sordellii ATCC 9714]